MTEGADNVIGNKDIVAQLVTKDLSQKRIEQLEASGFKTLEELLGADWESKAIGNSVIALAKRDLGENIKEKTEDEPELDTKTKRAIDYFKRQGDTVSFISSTKDGNESNYFLVSRDIINARNQVVCSVWEMVDTSESGLMVLDKPSGGETVLYIPKSVYLETGKAGNEKVVDLKSLGDSSEEVEFLCGDFEYSDSARKQRVSEMFASRKGNNVYFTSIRTIDNLFSFFHEFGHLAYANFYDFWPDTMDEARYIYNKKLPETPFMTALQARALISFNERAAWDFERKFIDFMKFDLGCPINLEEWVADFPAAREDSLETYDLVKFPGEDANPAAFSKAYRKIREMYLKQGGSYKFDPQTGESISNCSVRQIALENSMGKKELSELLLNTGVVADSRAKKISEEI